MKVSEVNPCTSKQIAEQAVPIIETVKDLGNKIVKKLALPIVWSIHIKALKFVGSTHWLTYLHQFEAAAHTK